MQNKFAARAYHRTLMLRLVSPQTRYKLKRTNADKFRTPTDIRADPSIVAIGAVLLLTA
jgi:hypothetical protein